MSYQRFLAACRQHPGDIVLMSSPGGHSLTFDHHAIEVSAALDKPLLALEGRAAVALSAADVDALRAAGERIRLAGWWW